MRNLTAESRVLPHVSRSSMQSHSPCRDTSCPDTSCSDTSCSDTSWPRLRAGVGAALVVALVLAGCGADPEPVVPAVATRPAVDLAPVDVAVIGDVHAEAPIDGVLAEGDNPLAGVAPQLAAADLAIANVETAVGSAGAPVDKSYTFQAPTALWDALVDAGVDVVSLANNHALDHGVEGLVETIDGARAAGLRVVGAGRTAQEAYAPVVVHPQGTPVAVVGLTRVMPELGWAATPERPGLASAYDTEAAVAAVAQAARTAPYVVVVVHWGDELAACPDDDQLVLAEALVAAGADVVAGAHPHVLQGIEREGPALVAYSLGNAVFYARSEETRRSAVLEVTLAAASVDAHALHPARIDDRGRPQPLAGADAEAVHTAVAARSPGGSVGCGFVAPPG